MGMSLQKKIKGIDQDYKPELDNSLDRLEFESPRLFIVGVDSELTPKAKKKKVNR